MAEALMLDNTELVPLVNSQRVVYALKTHEVDYGVVAVKNSIGGQVKETFDAIKDEQLELVSTTILDIHHCLFKLANVDAKDLTHVASHIQALKQTRKHRAEACPNLQELEIEDTAIGAQWLASGMLPPSTAVLCRANAGATFGLELIETNLEDEPDNRTEFRMFRLPTLNYDEEVPPRWGDRILYACVTQRGIGVLGKAILIFGVFAALFFAGSPLFDSMDIAVSLGGVVSALLLYLTSNKAKNLMQFRSLKGYWKYYSIPDKSRKSGFDMLYETPRIVVIDVIDDELYMKGWLCDKTSIPFFESTKTIVSPSDKPQGSLVYWYQDPREVGRGASLGGFAELNWLKKHPSTQVNRMSGRYSGRTTNETGCLVFYRITEEEFDVHRKCQFLGKTK